MTTLLLFALLALQTPGERHRACLAAEGTRLEASGENASDVALATITACVNIEVPITAGSPLASVPFDQQADIIRGQREIEADRVRLMVTEIRLCRKTRCAKQPGL